MAVRTFASPDGSTWNVWEVIPDNVTDARFGYGSHLPAALAGGWLCFDCGTEKRRLAPLPPNWDRRTEAELWFLCRAAEPVRGRAPGGCAAVPRDEDPAVLAPAAPEAAAVS